jgi:hypothetical protein
LEIWQSSVPFHAFVQILILFRGRYLLEATWHDNRLSLCGSMYVQSLFFQIIIVTDKSRLYSKARGGKHSPA